jgi:Flp pilus assembly protein TadG
MEPIVTVASEVAPQAAPTVAPRQLGQMIVLFAICLLAMISIAGLLIDGGMAWANRRQAQAAADSAALAAAYALINGQSAAGAGQSTAGQNGFSTDLTDCNGNVQKDMGVQVFNPPPAGSVHAGSPSYVEVVTTRAMRTTFAGAIGQSCWLVSARAQAFLQLTSPASCSFCSLNSSVSNHTLMMKNSSTLRIDGDIYVNSANFTNKLSGYFVYGDGFDVFGSPPAGVTASLSAKTISVHGGWETHNANVAKADGPASNCPSAPVPPSSPTSTNVCIGAPLLLDPLANMPEPIYEASPQVGRNGCPVGAVVPTGTSSATSLLSVTTSATLCPGTYYGGLSISGSSSVTVTMLAGNYIMASGGFTLTEGANLNASAGVMVFNGNNDPFAQTFGYPTIGYPAPIAGLADPLVTITASPNTNPINTSTQVTFTLTVTDPAHLVAPTGKVDFYNGNESSFSNILCKGVILTAGASGVSTASCGPVSFSINALYNIVGAYLPSVSPQVYNAGYDTRSEQVGTATQIAAKAVTITTSGWIYWNAPTSGIYQGMTIFQTKTSGSTVTIAPGSTPPAIGGCTGAYMSESDTTPCGPLGGLKGTVYAPQSSATVSVTGYTSGRADLQVIAGKIYLDNGAGVRFAYTPGLFARSSVRLVN